MKKIIALLLIAISLLFVFSCKKDAKATTDTEVMESADATTDVEAPADADMEATTEETVEE